MCWGFISESFISSSSFRSHLCQVHKICHLVWNLLLTIWYTDQKMGLLSFGTNNDQYFYWILQAGFACLYWKYSVIFFRCDDTLCIWEQRIAWGFNELVSKMHPTLRFTYERKNNTVLLFWYTGQTLFFWLLCSVNLLLLGYMLIENFVLNSKN